MKDASIGLGNLILRSQSGDDISLRLSYEDEVFKLVFSSVSAEYFTIIMEDSSDVGSLVVLLESCFSFS